MATPGELPGPSVFEDGTIEKTDLVQTLATQIDKSTSDLLALVVGINLTNLDCGTPGDTPQFSLDCGSP